MGRKSTVYVKDVWISYLCPVKKRMGKIKLERPGDISASETPCETCGSHGVIEVEVKCWCGKNHIVEFRSW